MSSTIVHYSKKIRQFKIELPIINIFILKKEFTNCTILLATFLQIRKNLYVDMLVQLYLKTLCYQNHQERQDG